jgi:hypothetical protein
VRYDIYIYVCVCVCVSFGGKGLTGINEITDVPVSTGNTFQDLPRLHKTADNTERYT